MQESRYSRLWLQEGFTRTVAVLPNDMLLANCMRLGSPCPVLLEGPCGTANPTVCLAGIPCSPTLLPPCPLGRSPPLPRPCLPLPGPFPLILFAVRGRSVVNKVSDACQPPSLCHRQRLCTTWVLTNLIGLHVHVVVFKITFLNQVGWQEPPPPPPHTHNFTALEYNVGMLLFLVTPRSCGKASGAVSNTL